MREISLLNVQVEFCLTGFDLLSCSSVCPLFTATVILLSVYNIALCVVFLAALGSLVSEPEQGITNILANKEENKQETCSAEFCLALHSRWSGPPAVGTLYLLSIIINSASLD